VEGVTYDNHSTNNRNEEKEFEIASHKGETLPIRTSKNTQGENGIKKAVEKWSKIMERIQKKTKEALFRGR